MNVDWDAVDKWFEEMDPERLAQFDDLMREINERLDAIDVRLGKLETADAGGVA